MNQFEEAEDYWKNKIYKKWVVVVAKGRGKREQTEQLYVRSKTECGAIKTALFHAALKGARHINNIRVAHPVYDLKATEVI